MTDMQGTNQPSPQRHAIQSFFNGGVNSTVYATHRGEFDSNNLKTLRQISLLGCVVGIITTIVSLLAQGRFLNLTEGYIALAVVFGLVYLLTRMVLERFPKIILPFFYVLMTGISIVSIAKGTVMQPDSNAITAIVLVVAMPLFIIDKPFKVNTYFLLVAISFIVATRMTKDPDIARVDTVNMTVFFLLSTITSYQSIRLKIRDIISRSRLRTTSTTDALTGLRNRVFCEQAVSIFIEGSRHIDREQHPAALLVMDLDDFKPVNDQNGHDCGDEVLRLVGAALIENFRQTDVVARLGGDEFTVFMPECADRAMVEARIASLSERIRKIEVNGQAFPSLGISVGVAFFPQDGESFAQLYKSADTALYRAKDLGKNGYAFFGDPE